MSPATLSLRPTRAPGPHDIHCPTCQKLIFDGEVLLARVTRFGPDLTEACCKICKTWVKVPVVIAYPGTACASSSPASPPRS